MVRSSARSQRSAGSWAAHQSCQAPLGPALPVEAVERAGDVDADPVGVVPGGARHPPLVRPEVFGRLRRAAVPGPGERAAGLGVDVAGDAVDRAVGAPVDQAAGVGRRRERQVLVVRDRGVADADIGPGDLDLADAEVEDLAQDLIRHGVGAGDVLGVGPGAEVGEDAVLAEDQQERLAGALRVAPARDRVDRVGPGEGGPGRDLRRRGRHEGIHQQGAAHHDDGASERGGLRRRQAEAEGFRDEAADRRPGPDRGDDDGEGEDRAQRVAVTASRRYQAERDDIAEAERGCVPGRARDGGPVQLDGDQGGVEPEPARLGPGEAGEGLAGADRDPPGLAPLRGQRVRPGIQRYARACMSARCRGLCRFPQSPGARSARLATRLRRGRAVARPARDRAVHGRRKGRARPLHGPCRGHVRIVHR